tara:strand:+ start:71 stop:373 length:303 start_codon:yes stop_codon:yes gene_type:complete
MYLSITLSIVVVLLAAFTAFLVWFTFNLTRQIRYYDDELREIVEIVKNFTEHLESVHELEMFYGDETLRDLMRHSKEIVNIFSSYDLEEDTEDFDDNSEA